MQIHDLNTKELTDPAYVAFDDGTDTYKADFKAEIDNAAADAVADADLTDNTVAFTSGDATSPTAWTAVSVLTSGLTIKVLFNRISTMIKNVRWLYSKLGTTDISSIGGGTVTGAISSLNSKIKITYVNNSYSNRDALLSAIDDLASNSEYAADIKIPNSNALLIGLQDTSYYLRVIRFSSAQTLIIAFPVNPTRFFMLRKNNNVWESSWHTVALTVFGS